MAGEDTPNRAEFEFVAGVDEASFSESRANTIKNSEQTYAELKRLSQKANADEVVSAEKKNIELSETLKRRFKSDAHLSEEAAATRARLAEEAVAKEQAAEERLARWRRTAVESLQRQRSAALLAQFREEERIREATEKAEAAQFQKSAKRFLEQQELRKKMAGSRLSDMTRFDEDAEGGAAASQAGRGGGGTGGLRGQRALLRAGGRVAGLPGEATQIGALGLYGGSVAAIGGIIAGIAIIKGVIEASNEADEAQKKLGISAAVTGQTFGNQVTIYDSVRTSLRANREEAVALANAYGTLQLKSGGAVRIGDLPKFETLAAAQGLKPEDAAKAIEGLAKGNKEAFSSLTGESEAQAELLLDKYAKSIGTTSNKLTDMEKAQVLSNQAMKDAGDQIERAERNLDSLQTKWQQFKNFLSDAGEWLGDLSSASGNQLVYLLSGGYAGKGPQATYQSEVAGFDAQQAELNKQAIAHNLDEEKKRAAEAELNRQKTLSRETEARLKDIEDQTKSKGENYGAGQQTLTTTGVSKFPAQQQALTELRSLREKIQAEYDAYQQIRSQFSSEDQEKFDKSYQDKIQSLTDNIRSSLSQMADEAQARVTSLRNNIRESTEEFARLRLPHGADNPYVKLFAEAEDAAQKAQDRFGLLGQEAVDAYLKMQTAARDAARYDLEVKDSMSAVRMEFEAAELAKPFKELTGEMKRTLMVFQEEVKAATSVPELLANANLIGRGASLQQRDRFGRIYTNPNDQYLTGNPLYQDRSVRINPRTGRPEVNEDYVKGQEYGRLTDLQQRYGGAPGAGGDEVRHQLNQEFIKLFSSLSETAKNEVLRNPQFSQQFAGAYRGEAQYQEAQVKRASERAEALRAPVRLAQRQLAELSRLSGQPNADTGRTREEFLAITGALPREELTPELEKGRIAALQQSAAERRAREDLAVKAIKDTKAFQDNLVGKDGKSGLLGNLATKIGNRENKVIVQVLDQTGTARASSLGNSFSPTLPGLPSGVLPGGSFPF